MKVGSTGSKKKEDKEDPFGVKSRVKFSLGPGDSITGGSKVVRIS